MISTMICLIQKTEDTMPQDYVKAISTLKHLLGMLRFQQISDVAGIIAYYGVFTEAEKKELSSAVKGYSLIFIELDTDNSAPQEKEYLTFKA